MCVDFILKVSPFTTVVESPSVWLAINLHNIYCNTIKNTFKKGILVIILVLV